MNFNLNCLFVHRSHRVLQSVWQASSRCWPGSVTEGGLPASRGWLRRFLLLKLITVLLLPHGAAPPLLVGCTFSLWALLLLRSPHISTKPSTVLLAQLALADSLVLLRWLLQLGMALDQLMKRRMGREADSSHARREGSVWCRDTASILCQQLLDAHQLISLLLLGLLGLEAMLVQRWPLQTRRIRTSHWTRLSCNLVWILVLLELVFQVYSRHLQDFRQQGPPSSLPGISVCLKRMLWMVNSWLHYTVFNSKPRRTKSSFH
ncbi:uncharacterized protein LOC133447645 [Cololabis saira]|uniref:uncharacterized protein LOC133447645 n=1 Tax=Cololabis saira TaxID=129043 RepID=UPI002AD27324|nr:uncharacterized protein LOC133447645 [Cololabis saira]